MTNSRLANTLDSRAHVPIKWSERHSFLDWLLCLLFSRFDIIKLGKPYMRRWFIGPQVFGRRLQVHLILAHDSDGAHHDHPWDAWFLIFWGGYMETMVCNLRPVSEEAGSWLLHAYDQRLFVPEDLPIIEDEAIAADPRRSPYPHLVPGNCIQIRRRPGLRFHPCRQPHTITRHLKGHTWTLSLLSNRKRAWGFWHEEKGWMPWRDFVAQKPDQSHLKTYRTEPKRA